MYFFEVGSRVCEDSSKQVEVVSVPLRPVGSIPNLGSLGESESKICCS